MNFEMLLFQNNLELVDDCMPDCAGSPYGCEYLCSTYNEHDMVWYYSKSWSVVYNDRN